MPSVSNMLLFVGAVAVLAITPGPDIVYVLTRGMAQGPRAGLAAALGFSTGCIGHTTFAVVGLTALLKASAVAFTVIKLAGAAYLIYLGLRMWCQAERFDVQGGGRSQPLGAIYRQSVLANLLNPKVAVFFLAFLPQFVEPEAGRQWVQLVIYGGLFTAVTVVVFGSVGLAAGALGRWLGRRPAAGTFIRCTAAVVLVGLGVKLAWPGH